ncbi:MAG: radical SAM protein [Promethearchaeota archaeon]
MSESTKKTINMLTFLVSYKCTNECKHCALQASPNQEDITVQPEDVRTYLENITQNYNISEVNFFGGEPLLNYNLLISLIEEAKKFDIPKIGLPTNGYWGKDEETAKKYALKLKEVGVNLIGFSADAFHQEFIPLENVKRAIKAAHKAEIETILIIAQTIGAPNESNSFNNETNKICKNISNEFKFCQIIKSPLQVRGRAIKNLLEYYPINSVPSEKCSIFRAPMYMIDPNGWVFSQGCQGICLGNAKKDSLLKIISEFKPRKHPIIGKVMGKGGVGSLLELAIEKGYEPLERYADKCHVCYSAQKFLRPYCPNILEPSNIWD